VWRNALGGLEPKGSRERLLWRNALAFASQGSNELSFAIARNLRTSRDEEIAFKAARLMDALKAKGVNRNTAHLKQAWSRSLLVIALHLAMLFVVPGLFLAVWLVL